MRTWKRKIVPSLVAGSLIFSLGTTAFADSKQGKGNGHGKGHTVTSVSKKNKQKNKPVTQLDAITAVMKLLNKENLLKNRDRNYTNEDLPNWANDTVEQALEYDIVSLEDLEQSKKPATRLFVVKLLVNALDADIEDINFDNPRFNDISALSSEEKDYISYALSKSLVQGYKDHTFQPNKPVTRGQLESYLKALLDRIEDGDYDNSYDVSGTIAKIYNDQIKIGSKTYDVSNDVDVFIDGRSADFEDLEVNMKIRVLIEDRKIEKIYAYTTENRNVPFLIKQISAGDIKVVEAVKTGARVTDTTPDLTDETLYISLNERSEKSIDLNTIDGREDDGDEVADELEKEIEDALDLNNRVLVTFDEYYNRFVFETTNSPDTVAPSIRFTGTALDELGLNSTIARGSLDGNSSRESWRITVKDDASKDQTYVIHFEDKNINEKVEFIVDDHDTKKQIASRIANELAANRQITDDYYISVNDDEVTITAKTTANKLDVNIDITLK